MNTPSQSLPERLEEKNRQISYGPPLTQEQAVHALLHQMHYRMRDASDVIFEVMKRKARGDSGGSLAMDLCKARPELESANRAMQNIYDLCWCSPSDPVEFDENGNWAPLKQKDKRQAGD